MELKGKVILVTGAARGLGAAIAKGVADKSGDLALVDLDAATLADTQRACEAFGVTARSYAADVANEEQVVALFNQKDFCDIPPVFGIESALMDSVLQPVGLSG